MGGGQRKCYGLREPLMSAGPDVLRVERHCPPPDPV
jgi:hypothetical protein